jgi:hypothetical protein
MTTHVTQPKQDAPAVAAFSAQETLEAAQTNITSLILATARYGKDRGSSFDEWVGTLGRLFAPRWREAEYNNPLAAARRAALNMVSAGAMEVAVAGDERRAQVTYRWPDDDWLRFFDLSRQEVESFSRIFAPIAEHLGLRFEYAPEGDRTRLTFAREPAGVLRSG